MQRQGAAALGARAKQVDHAGHRTEYHAEYRHAAPAVTLHQPAAGRHAHRAADKGGRHVQAVAAFQRLRFACVECS